MTVTAASTPTADLDDVRAAVIDKLAPLSEPFHLRTRIRVHAGERGARVQ